MGKERLYLSPPYMCGNEQKYVQEAFDTNWVSPLGPNVTAFEEGMAAYTGRKYAVATNAGTAAVHLSLIYLGAGQGDTVFCSDLTFSGSCNPIFYTGAEPVFIDSEPESFNMSPAALEDALAWAKKSGKLPKAVIVVDLYGSSADYDALLPICARYGVPVIEDAAEALGAMYGEHACGKFGELAILSFNGNKLVTSSGGGMVLTDDEAAAKKVLFYATQAREKELHYEHYEVGYNYRLSNVCAGIGRGQLEGLEERVIKRNMIYNTYARLLEGAPLHMLPALEKGRASRWLSVLVLDETKVTPMDICAALEKENIEARPAWKPMHMQPVFRKYPYFAHEGRDVGADLFARGVCLPSGEAMTLAQQEEIAAIIKGLL